MISVLILTHNEAHDLPACLASAAWSDDIHVVDSHSTDATAPIAQAAGAHVHPRAFDNYAAQRNFGLQLPYKHPWLFILDADERPTPPSSPKCKPSPAPTPKPSPPSASAAETSSSTHGSSTPS